MTNAVNARNTAAAKASASKYTPEMETELRSITGLNAEKAAEFAEKHGLSSRSVIAKINRMELPYIKKTRVTKSGGKIESKESITAQIAEVIGANLEGLEKAPKPVLQAVRDWVEANAA